MTEERSFEQDLDAILGGDAQLSTARAGVVRPLSALALLALGSGAFLVMKAPAGAAKADMAAATARIAPAALPDDAVAVPSAVEFAARDVQSGVVADRGRRQRSE